MVQVIMKMRAFTCQSAWAQHGLLQVVEAWVQGAGNHEDESFYMSEGHGLNMGFYMS